MAPILKNKRCPCCNGVVGERKSYPPFVATREEWEQLRTWRKTMSWREIAEKRNLSIRGAWLRGKRLEAVFGPLPFPVTRRWDRRDYARDFVRMKELKDAGLPWRMIGAAVGLKAQSAAAYYSRLLGLGYS